MVKTRPQIDPWKAIAFAVDPQYIDDHYDRLDFLNSCLECDMIDIAEDYPDFAEYCKKGQST